MRLYSFQRSIQYRYCSTLSDIFGRSVYHLSTVDPGLLLYIADAAPSGTAQIPNVVHHQQTWLTVKILGISLFVYTQFQFV